MATADVIQDQDEQEQEHLGGGRFNRLLGVVFVAVAMLGGVVPSVRPYKLFWK